MLLFESNLTYLWFHKHQINEQHDKVVLDILIREALATGTLCQSYISTPSSGRSLGLCFRDLWYIGDGLLGAWKIGAGLLVSRLRDRRRGDFVVPTVEDVVELRDGIATFDTYWHNALKRVFTSLFLCSCVPVFRRALG